MLIEYLKLQRKYAMLEAKHETFVASGVQYKAKQKFKIEKLRVKSCSVLRCFVVCALNSQ